MVWKFLNQIKFSSFCEQEVHEWIFFYTTFMLYSYPVIQGYFDLYFPSKEMFYMSIKMGITKTFESSQQKCCAYCLTQTLFEAAGEH